MKHLLALLDAGTRGTRTEPSHAAPEVPEKTTEDQPVIGYGTRGTRGTLQNERAAGEIDARVISPCPSDITERSAILAEAAGLEPIAADARALAESGLGTWEEFAADLRSRIATELENLPPPADQRSRRLLEVTRAFIASPWFSRSVALGWSLPELFGVDPVAPRTRLDRFGLALSVIPGGRLETIEADCAGIRYRSGSLLTFRRFRPALDDVVTWWQCPALIGEAHA